MKVIYDKEKQKVPIKCWCNNPEDGAIEQAVNLANHPAIFHHVALMPDTHFGYGMPIGGVVGLKNAICPSGVGVDIGCGMGFIKTSIDVSDVLNTKTTNGDGLVLAMIRNIKRNIPTGQGHHKELKPHLVDIAKKLVDKHFEVVD